MGLIIAVVMAKEDLDDLNKEIISDIEKEQRVDKLLKYAEEPKQGLSLFKKRKKEEKKSLPEMDIPEPSTPLNKPLEKSTIEPIKPLKPLSLFDDLDKKPEPIKDAVFKEKKRFGLFRRKEKPRLEPLEPIQEKTKQGFNEEDFMPKPSDIFREPMKEEDFMPSVEKTEQKLKEEGLIKSDFSIKELPAGEKEVKEPAGLIHKAKSGIKRLDSELNKKKTTKSKPVKKPVAKKIKKQVTKKTNKIKIPKPKKKLDKRKNIIEDKAISLKVKESKVQKLKKDLTKKDTKLGTREKFIEEESKKYEVLLKEINSLKNDLKKQKSELDKKEKSLEKKEKHLEKKENEADIDDRALDYAMSEFEKEKIKLEDDEFHAYLKSKVSEIHGEPVPKSSISIADIKKTDSLRIPNLSDKKLSIQESIEKCRALVVQGKIDQAKYLYNGLRLEFVKKQIPEPDRTRLHNQIRELYDSINLASLNR